MLPPSLEKSTDDGQREQSGEETHWLSAECSVLGQACLLGVLTEGLLANSDEVEPQVRSPGKEKDRRTGGLTSVLFLLKGITYSEWIGIWKAVSGWPRHTSHHHGVWVSYGKLISTMQKVEGFLNLCCFPVFQDQVTVNAPFILLVSILRYWHLQWPVMASTLRIVNSPHTTCTHTTASFSLKPK